ncbi:hypothetical protein ACYSNR_16985 [Enterococcus sp. LJL128]
MKVLSAVMRTQRKLFFKDKGLLIFYGLSILGIGGVFPLFFKELALQFTLAVFMCVTMQKQWTAESIAGEREAGTLESVMTTPLSTSGFLLGKALYNVICALVYAGAMGVCIFIVRNFSDTSQEMTPVSWIVILCGFLFVILVAAFYGVLCSSKAETIQRAGRRPTILCYVFSLFFVILLTVLTNHEINQSRGLLVISIGFFCSSGGVILYSVLKILHIDRPSIIEIEKQSKYEMITISSRGRKHLGDSRIRNQVEAVFFHELHYLKSLKMLQFQFGILTLCPAGLQLTMWLMYGLNDLSYSVLLLILIMPRIPTNLIAYSIGGEKAYNTGETILSTPVLVSALFWGKAIVPCFVSIVMLLVSAALHLIAANLFSVIEGTQLLFYTPSQLVLLIGVGLATSFSMVLVSTILSLKAKTPRKGLYYSTFLGFVFFMPATVISYQTNASLGWSLVYFIVLLFVNIFLYNRVKNVSRDELMTKL